MWKNFSFGFQKTKPFIILKIVQSVFYSSWDKSWFWMMWLPGWSWGHVDMNTSHPFYNSYTDCLSNIFKALHGQAGRHLCTKSMLAHTLAMTLIHCTHLTSACKNVSHLNKTQQLRSNQGQMIHWICTRSYSFLFMVMKKIHFIIIICY